MQKQIVPQEAATDFAWIDVEENAKLQLTSEEPGHPIEAALRGDAKIGWQAEDAGPQSIRLSFYTPQAINRVYLRIDAEDDRTHQFVLRWSNDSGVSYRDIVRQQYNFSAAARREEETYLTELRGVTDLKLEIIPDISGGSAVAALRAFRIG